MSIVPGVAFGDAFVVRRRRRPRASGATAAIDASYEIQKLNEALDQLRQELQFIKRKVAEGVGEVASRLFDVQEFLLKDRRLIDDIERAIRQQGIRLDDAIELALQSYEVRFGKVTDPYLQEKFLDVKDVLTRIGNRSVIRDTQKALETAQHRVLVAEEILPSVILAPGDRPFDGIVTVVGGLGAHATILTKSYGIPVVGVAESAIRWIRDGDRVVVDSQTASIFVNPDDALLAELLVRKVDYETYRTRIGSRAAAVARTRDGQPVAVHANCGTAADIDEARDQGADGIGLLRTEFLFQMQSSLPDEDDQFDVYSQAAATFPGRPVVIRTLDLGGDKTLPAFLLPQQLNPYLGWRSLRVSFDHPAQFKAQIRAILRAGVADNVRILFPMVTTYGDAARCGSYVAECRDELRAAGAGFNPDVPRGGMIETPAAVTRLEDIAHEFDFLAIGSNDLTQHLLAVDRDNPRVAEFYLPHHPAVVTVIKDIVARSDALGTPVSLCGEMAADPYYLVLLVGLGLRQVSVAPTLVPICKDVIRHITVADAARIADTARSCKTAGESLEVLVGYVRGNYPDIDQLVRESGTLVAGR